MITTINHITLAVTNIERSFSFYHDVIGFKPLVKWDAGAYFLIGEEGFWFCLNVDSARKPTECYTHYAFSVPEREFDLMVERITRAAVLTFKENTSPGKSFYFLDPDGHKLEIHAGNWQDRVIAKKADAGNWANVEWYV